MRILMLCVFLVIIFLSDLLKMPYKIFYPYFAVPVTLLYPISLLVTIIWLFHYEKINGPVYLERE